MYRWSGDGRALGSVFYFFACVCVGVYKTCFLCLSVCVCARGCMFILAVSSGFLLCAPVNTCTGLYKHACIGALLKQRPWAAKENDEILKNSKYSRY